MAASTFWPIVVGVSCLKVLTLHSYRSTDFEVHRNWLAITHSLPWSQWYQDDTSPWTLDYPPLFAWWEFLLSQVAVFFDSEMVEVANLNYASDATILFQRLSVIVSDLILALGVRTCFRGIRTHSPLGSRDLSALLALVLTNGGLIMVDHVHFQYNGFLFGVALQSLGCILLSRPIESAFWFTVVLNLKHIYLYCAPVYFVYLLRSHVLEARSLWTALGRLIQLGSTVIGVVSLSFGPWIAQGQLWIVIERLFPFKRGLCHAYWAPNFWALFNACDKVLFFANRQFHLLPMAQNQTQAAMTGGLVQEFDHAILPSISPAVTLVLSVCSMLPALFHLWRHPGNHVVFLQAIVLCNFGSYLFGWHVHEKAILHVTIPLTILACLERREATILMYLGLVAHTSLLPLLFRPEETVLKLSILVFHAVFYIVWFRHHHKSVAKSVPLALGERLYCLGLGCVVLFDLVGFGCLPQAIQTAFPFLPLLLYSTYCALGLHYGWVQLYRAMFQARQK